MSIKKKLPCQSPDCPGIAFGPNGFCYECMYFKRRKNYNINRPPLT